jgi:putative transposase
LLKLYRLQVFPDLISTVTDEVLDEIEQGLQAPLETMYLIVQFDAVRMTIRDEGTVRSNAVYLALSIRAGGHKEVLGLWIEHPEIMEGIRFWVRVFNELKSRCLDDILIAAVDSSRGFPEVIDTVNPAVQIQT